MDLLHTKKCKKLNKNTENKSYPQRAYLLLSVYFSIDINYTDYIFQQSSSMLKIEFHELAK